MARVSKRFAEKVSTYKGDGLTVASAEGSGISKSKESLEEGLALADAAIARLRQRAATTRRMAVKTNGRLKD